MAPRRKRSNLRKILNINQRQDFRLKVMHSAPVLLSEQKDVCTVTTEHSCRAEGAKCSRHPEFEAKSRENRGVYDLRNIPDDTLLRIMSFFTPLQLVRSVGPTCHRTLDLSRHPELWRRLKLDKSLELTPEQGQPRNSPSVAARLLCMAGTNLRSLEITERHDAAFLMEQIGRRGRAVCRTSIPQLRALELRRIPGPFPAKILLRSLRRFPDIRRLVLRDVRRLRSMVFFRKLGSSLPQLSCLDVGHCPQFGTLALAAVATSGLALRELRAFRERGYRSSMPHAADEDFSLFCELMKDSITVIKINAISLTDQSCKMLITCTHLTTLHLRDARGFTGQGIMNILSHLAKLKSVDLTGAIHVTSGKWAEIFENMAAAPTIEVLKLAGCFGIDDFSARHMKFPALCHLSLSGCLLLGEVGCSFIITRCNNLCHLDLEGTRPAICLCFHLLPVYTPKLEVLVFPTHACPINILVNLISNMKHLKIYNHDQPKRVKYWRAVAIDDELRRMNENEVPI